MPSPLHPETLLALQLWRANVEDNLVEGPEDLQRAMLAALCCVALDDSRAPAFRCVWTCGRKNRLLRSCFGRVFHIFSWFSGLKTWLRGVESLYSWLGKVRVNAVAVTTLVEAEEMEQRKVALALYPTLATCVCWPQPLPPIGPRAL